MVYNPAAKKLFSVLMLVCMMVSSLQPMRIVSAQGSAPQKEAPALGGMAEVVSDSSERQAPLVQETAIPTEELSLLQDEGVPEFPPESFPQGEFAAEENVIALGDEEWDASTGDEMILVNVSHGLVQVFGFVENIPLTFTISQGVETLWSSDDYTSDEEGNGFLSSYDHEIIPIPGMVYSVTGGEVTRSVTIVPLTVDGVDYDADTIWGTAPPDATILVDCYSETSSNAMEVVSDSNGDWLADMSTLSIKLTEDMSYSAEIFNSEGDIIIAYLLEPRIEAYPGEDRITGYHFSLGADITVTIWDGETRVWGPVTKTVDYSGRVYFDDLDSFDLAVGQTVQVTDGKYTKSLLLTDIRISGVNYITDRLWGSADADQFVSIEIYNYTSGDRADLVVQADGTGYWEADFSGMVDVIIAGLITAAVIDEDGDKTCAKPLPVPYISASLSHGSIKVENAQPFEQFQLTIREGENNLFGPEMLIADENGRIYLSESNHGVYLEPGITIVLASSSLTKTLILSQLEVLRVDSETDQISGRGEVGADLGVCVHYSTTGIGECTWGVVAGDGTWTADFAGLFDIQPGFFGTVHQRNEEEDETTTRLPEMPRIEASAVNQWVSGRYFKRNAELIFSVKDGEELVVFGPQTLTTDSYGSFWFDLRETPFILESGMTVTASDGLWTKELLIRPIQTRFVDFELDSVSGLGEANTTLRVCVYDVVIKSGECLENIVVAENGGWLADFSGIFDIRYGAYIDAYLEDDDFDSTVAELPRTPHIEVSMVKEWVGGWNFEPDAELIFSVRGAEDELLFGPQTLTTLGDGSFSFADWGASFQLGAGMTVTASDGLWTKVLLLENVSIDHVDEAAEQISGSAPPSAQLRVEASTGPDNPAIRMDVVADEEGNWLADFSGQINLQAGVRVGVYLDNGYGDCLVYDMTIGAGGFIIGNLVEDNFQFKGFSPAAEIEVEVFDSADGWLYGPAMLIADQEGFAKLARQEHSLDLLPGMRVTASDQTTGVVKELVLEALMLSEVDYASDTLSGSALPNTPVNARLHWNNLQSSFDLEVLTDDFGVWLADFGDAEMDLLPYMIPESTIVDTDGDRTVATLSTPPVSDIVRVSLAGAEPGTLDPSFATESGEQFVIDQLFAGLVGLDDDTAQVIPELAQSWTVSPDGRVYTFTLRNDPKWSDGTPITAQDARFGILRAVGNTSDSSLGYILDPIENAWDFREGSVSADQVGVVALSATQLEITLDEPDSSFLWALAMPVGRPLPQSVVETWGENWTAPEHIVSSGAYQLTWCLEDGLKLQKNANYYDTDLVQIDEVMWYFEEEVDAWRMYVDGQVDTLNKPEEIMYDRVQETYLNPYPQVEYYGFNLSQPPFDDTRVRKAFIASVNRSGLVAELWGERALAALSLTPPGTFGAVDGYAEGIGIPYDPNQAQQWLAQAGYPGGVGLPPITLSHNEGAGHSANAEYIRGNWLDILGVDVAEQSSPWNEYLSGVDDGDYQLWRMGWSGDYPEAINFLRDAILDGSSRFGNWDSSAYEDLIELAELEQNPENRKLLYQQAEEILVEDDAVLLPLYYKTNPTLTRRYLERTHSSPERGHIADWRITTQHSEVLAGEPLDLKSEDEQTRLQSVEGLFDTTVEAVYVPMYGPLPAGKGDIGQGFEFYAYDKESWQLAPLQEGKTYNLTIDYLDEDVDGIAEESLNLYHWNPQTKSWKQKSADVFDTSTNTLSAAVDQLGLWSVFGDLIPKEPVVRGNLDDESISGAGFTPGGEVTVKVYNPGASTLAWQSSSVPLSQSGNFWLTAEDHSLNFRPGSKIVAADSTIGIEKTLILSTLSVSNEVDFEAAVVWGTSPREEQVSVLAQGVDWGLQLDVVADETGKWTANFGSQDFELDADTDFTAWAADADGDETVAQALAPYALDLVSIRVQAMAPATLDPSLASDTSSGLFLEQLFIGLVDQDDETGAIRPELAQSWTVSPDGTVYTFTLRNDAKWSDGTPITAYDARYGILRAIDPAVGSDNSYVLEEIIQNAHEFHQGGVEMAEVGVKALSATNLEITLTHPASYFLTVLSTPYTRPLPQATIEWCEAEEEDWTDAAHLVTSGAYRVTRRTDGYILMDKNPFYYDMDNVAIDRVKFLHVDGTDAWDMYLNGELDTIAVPGEVEPDAELAGELHTSPRMCTYYYGFNTEADVVNDVRVRRALSLAVDRQALIDQVLGGRPEPARWFSRPGLVAAPTLQDYPNLGVGYDPVEANVLLQDYLTEVGMSADQLEIELWFNTGSVHQDIAQFVQGMWYDELGITVDLHSEAWDPYLARITGSETPQVWRLGWCMEYPDAKNFIQDAFASGGSANPTDEFGDPMGGVFWRNPAFESLLNDAAISQNVTTRTDLYAQAEQILIWEDAVMLPLYWYTDYKATKPYLDRGYHAGGDDDISTWRLAEEYALNLFSDPKEGGDIAASLEPNSAGGRYLPGTRLELEALPVDGYTFESWDGDLAGSDNPVTIYMFKDQEIIAHFREVVPPTIVKVDTVAQTPDKRLSEGEVTDKSITAFKVQFSEAINDPPGDDDPADVTNLANYAVTELGEDEWPGGGDDVPVGIDEVVYNAATRTATLSLEGGQPLPIGKYQLWVSGSSSIEDLAGNKLDGNGDGVGGDDFSLVFTVSFTSGTPILDFPANGAQISEVRPSFTWGAASDASSFEIQLSSRSDFRSLLENATLGAGVLTFTPGADLADGKYYWRVRGLNRFDLPGPWSKAFAFTVDTISPPSPVLSSPANTAVLRALSLFTWKSAPGALQYQFQLADTSNFETELYTSAVLSAANFALPLTLAQGTYYWRVRAVDAAGNWGNWADCGVNVFNLLPSLPSAPKLISLANKSYVNDNMPQFSWGEVAGAYQYQIQIDTTSSFTHSDKQDVLLLPGENIYVAPPLAEGKYYWRVRTLNDNLEMGPWSSAWYFTVDTLPTQPPTLAAFGPFAVTADTTPTFKVQKVVGASQYLIGVWDNPALSGDAVWASQGSGVSATIPFASALAFGEYSWAAQAIDLAGNASPWSGPYRLMVTYLQKPAPQSFTTDSTPKLSWGGVTGATAYWLEVSAHADLSTPIILEPDLTKNSRGYTIPEAKSLVPGDYYWRMKYQKDGVWSEYSLIWGFTVTPPPPAPPALDLPSTGYLTASGDVHFAWQEVVAAAGYRIEIDKDAKFRSPLVNVTLAEGVRETTATNLADGKYYWRVCSRNEYGAEGNWSKPRSFEVDTLGPPAPILYSPAPAFVTADTTPLLRVIRVKDARQYRFQIWDNATFVGDPVVEVLQTTYSWTVPAVQALPYGEVFWRVQAVDAAGNSSAWSDTNPLTISFLKSPQNGSYLLGGTPTLFWTPVSGAIGYALEISTTPDFADFVIQEDAIPPGTTRYAVSEADSLSPGRYYWRMRALMAGGSSESTPFWEFGLSVNLPGTPQTVSPAAGTLTNDPRPRFEWTAVEPGAASRLCVDSDPKFRTPEFCLQFDPGQLTYTPSLPLPDGRFYWRIQALDGIGAPGTWSKSASFVVDTRAPAAPRLSSPSPNVIVRGNPTFSWRKASTAVLYQFQLRNTPGFAEVEYTSPSLSFTNHNLPEVLPPGSYSWRVRARDLPGNWGEWSEPQIVTILLGIPARSDLLSPANKARLEDAIPKLEWKAVAYGNTYEVQLADNSKFSVPQQEASLDSETWSWTPEPLLPGKYYWRVRAVNLNGEKGAWSAVRYFYIN